VCPCPFGSEQQQVNKSSRKLVNAVNVSGLNILIVPANVFNCYLSLAGILRAGFCSDPKSSAKVMNSI
jgi:hypothetical protein